MPTDARAPRLLTVLGLLAVLSGPSSAAAAAAEWPASIRAVYRVSYNGIEVGTFNFASEAGSGGYTLTSDARLSALFGAFNWSGVARSQGTIGKAGPAPSSYEFDFKSTTRDGAVRMRFARNEVAQLTVLPDKPPKPDVVPLQRDHFKGVFDPLSAILALGRVDQANRDLCQRTLAIFDGKHRFDLALSYRRDVRIQAAKSAGATVPGQLCRIRYTPVAGHRENDETRDLARNQRAEVILRPVPDAGIAVPHEIRIPTFGGDIVITSRQIEITTAQRQRIALVN